MFQVKFYDVFKYAFEDKYLTYSEFDRNIEKLYYSNKHNMQLFFNSRTYDIVETKRMLG